MAAEEDKEKNVAIQKSIATLFYSCEGMVQVNTSVMILGAYNKQ
jgi:hypothetical protein